MFNTYFLLFLEFFKTGLFTFGGGLASLPLLYEICDKYSWFSQIELTQIIAISALTPGPVGLNMATFAGFKTLGIFGSLTSSLALVLPMIIITSMMFRVYRKYCENRYVKSMFYILKPTSCALICAVAFRLFFELIFNNSFDITKLNYNGVIILFILFLLTFKFSSRPNLFIIFAAILGGILSFM